MLNTNLHSTAVEKLRAELAGRVIGQPAAIDAVVNTYELYNAGLHTEGQPIANFCFLGPTGTGKTRTVEALAEALYGSRKAILKVDCGEYQHSHEIAKLVGSPPGYLGHRETQPALSQARLNEHFKPDGPKISLVLFDEIEKASDALWKILLGVLDKGSLTLGDNTRVDFSQSIIFMTSNLGADKMAELFSPGVGFHRHEADVAKITAAGVEAARRKFPTEFFNRLDRDNIVTFNPLTKEDMGKILDLELNKMQQTLIKATLQSPVYSIFTPEAKDFLIEKGFDRRYGARPLVQAVKSYVTRPLAALLGSGQLKEEVVVDAGEEGLTFTSFQQNEELKAA